MKSGLPTSVNAVVVSLPRLSPFTSSGRNNDYRDSASAVEPAWRRTPGRRLERVLVPPPTPARGRPAPDGNALEASPRAAVPRRAWIWPALMHRVFALDVLACPRCGPTRLGRNRVDSSLDGPRSLTLAPCTRALTASPRRRRITGAQRVRLRPTLAFALSTAPFQTPRRGSRGRPDCLDAGRPRGGGVNRSYARGYGTSRVGPIRRASSLPPLHRGIHDG